MLNISRRRAGNGRNGDAGSVADGGLRVMDKEERERREKLEADALRGLDKFEFCPPRERPDIQSTHEQLVQLEQAVVANGSWTSSERSRADRVLKELHGQLEEFALAHTSAAHVKAMRAHSTSKLMRTCSRNYAKAKRLVDEDEAELASPGVVHALVNDFGECTPLQGTCDVVQLYEWAVKVKPMFDAALKEVHSPMQEELNRHGQPRVQLVLAPLKHLYRIVEKVAYSSREEGASAILDVVRSTLECDSLKHMHRVVAAIAKSPALIIERVKDRWTCPTADSWSDVMLNVRVAGDETQMMCEVQVCHRNLLVVRRALGGHKAYNTKRAADEITALLHSRQMIPVSVAESHHKTEHSWEVQSTESAECEAMLLDTMLLVQEAADFCKMLDRDKFYFDTGLKHVADDKVAANVLFSAPALPRWPVPASIFAVIVDALREEYLKIIMALEFGETYQTDPQRDPFKRVLDEPSCLGTAVVFPEYVLYYLESDEEDLNQRLRHWIAPYADVGHVRLRLTPSAGPQPEDLAKELPEPEDPQELLGQPLHVRVSIDEAVLSPCMLQKWLVEYDFPNSCGVLTSFRTPVMESCSRKATFNYSHMHTIDSVDQSLIDLLSKSLEFRLYGTPSSSELGCLAPMASTNQRVAELAGYTHTSRHAAKQHAATYVAEHRLQEVLSQSVNQVVRDRASDPLMFLADCLVQRAGVPTGMPTTIKEAWAEIERLRVAVEKLDD